MAMRIGGNDNLSSAQELQRNTSTPSQSPTTNQAQAGSAFNQTTTNTRNTSGQLRQAENGIGANLIASQLRGSSSPSLESITKNVASSMKSARPASGGTDGVVATGQTNIPLPDKKSVATSVSVATGTPNAKVGTLKINLDIAHTYPGDLEIKLKSPSGKEVTIFNREGGRGTGVNLVGKDLSAQFAGEAANGNWTLTINDKAAQDSGTLKSWGLDVRPSGSTGGGGTTPTGPTNLQIVGDAAFRARAAQDLAKFAPGTRVDANTGFVYAATTKTAGHDTGYQLVDNLLNGGKLVTIGFTPDNAFTQSGTGAQGSPSRPSTGSTAQVSYDPSLAIKLPVVKPNGTIGDEGIDSAVVLAHELVHATHAQRGTIDRSLVDHTFKDGDKTFTENWRFEELRTTGFAGFRQGNEPTENSIRAELGYNPRATYLDRSSWVAGSSSNGISANRTGSNSNVAEQENSWRPERPLQD